MSVVSLINDHNSFKIAGGMFEYPKKFIRLTGPDTIDFLHRMTTQNVKELTPGLGLPTAILQPSGMIISFFNLYHTGQYFLLVIEPELFQPTWDALEKFHFSEDMTIEDISGEFSFLSVQGTSQVILKEILGRLPNIEHELIGTEETFIAKESDFDSRNSAGYHLMVKKVKFDDLKTKLISKGLPVFGRELWELLRAESGHFRFGIDISEKNLILESALSGFLSRNKGCYPGQEVVERIFTYGNVAKKLVGLEFQNNSRQTLTTPTKLLAAEKEVGVVTSIIEIPWSHQRVAFAIVRKPFFEPGNQLKLADQNVNVKVVNLPNAFEIKRELAKE